MSYDQYSGWYRHIKDRHRVLYRDCVKDTTKLLKEDACPVGLPETLTVAHIGSPNLGPTEGLDPGCHSQRILQGAFKSTPSAPRAC